MNGAKRREEILNLIKNSQNPLSGSVLSEKVGVSRQVIVKDISILKTDGFDILSTNKGYVLHEEEKAERIFKIVHTDDEVGDELSSIVDLGGSVENVFVWHRIYGKIEAKLNIATRSDVSEYLESLRTGRSVPLKNITSGYHYHTVKAKTEDTLDLIEKELDKKGYLVREE